MPPASPQSPAPAGPPPLPRAAVIDRYFLEHRAKLIDLAAFLDRVDRAEPGDAAEPDPRLAALRRAIGVLAEPDPGRAARVLRLLSDPTDRPIDSAAGLGPARGAYHPPADASGEGRRAPGGSG